MLQFELLIHGATSLKDKRRVVHSVRDRLHREHLAAVAEVGALDTLNLASMAVAVIARDGRRAGEVLDQIHAKLRGLRDAELGAASRSLIHGETPAADPADPAPGLADVGAELLARMGREEPGR